MATPAQAGFAFLVLGAALVIGKLIRMNVGWVQKLFLPSSIVGGFILLALGPDGLGRILGGRWAAAGIYTPQLLAVMRALPGLLISVVFATMFLGQNLPSPRKALKLAGPQVSLGFVYGSSQYVFGILLFMLFVTPVFGAPPVFAALVEIGFEGGHGTAAGMRPVFDQLGFPQGGDLAVAVATFGLVFGVILGIAFINWGTRTGKTEIVQGEAAQLSKDEQRGLFARDEHYPHAGHLAVRPASIEPISLHAAVVCLSILVGWVMLEALRWIENMTWGRHILQDGVPLQLFRFLPLFPMALIGGVLVQRLARAVGLDYLLDPAMMLRIQGLALDFLIVSAIGSMSMGYIAQYLPVFLIICLIGTLGNTIIFFVLTPRLIGRFWFERGIADFGQSMGVTATGLMLLRIVDPEYASPAFNAFGIKQLIFEPFYGGGLVTALSVPLIFFFGPVPFLIANLVVFLVALIWGLVKFGGQAKREHAERLAGVPYTKYLNAGWDDPDAAVDESELLDANIATWDGVSTV